MIDFFSEHTGVAMGLFIAFAGLIVWLFPQLTTGYYNVPRGKRNEVDWRRVRRYLAIGFTALGAAVAVLDLVIGNEEVYYPVGIAVAFLGVLTLIGTAQRFDRKKR